MPEAKFRSCKRPRVWRHHHLCSMKEENLLPVKWSQAPAVRCTPRLRNNNTGHNACLGLKQVACCSHQKTGTRTFLAASLTIQKQYPLTIALAKKRRRWLTQSTRWSRVKQDLRGIPCSQGLRRSLQGMQDRPLVRELGSHMPPGQNKTLNKQYCKQIFLKKGKNYSYTQHQR